MRSPRAVTPSRRPLLPTPSALLTLSLTLALAAASGCSRRVEEAAVQGSWVGTTATPPKKPIRGPCIKPTPETPARALKPGPDPRCPDDPQGNFDLRTGKVIFTEVSAPDVAVEVAETDPHRTRGLMYRKSMPENQGMIFVFEGRENHTFWMRNTCIQLDMLFIDADGTIVGIEENTTTMTDRTFQVGCPSTYVLELNAGWTRKHGVKPGQKVRLEGI
ncbi:DUF192 domain-containing protein [Chondromyces apiculatus]|uniref:DUF192 domain-containing protein n=1 Tax=Chondromyces apiculatus DSM 436 TaxID=1192034 RepID=A0A017TF83_9BACT|nr:DUF192 domain-containing protein [Chondromyces apiculatus]EYF07953.1 Hypothetical protein CAP_6975 [Chondromyces apiculatus DSM 436]